MRGTDGRREEIWPAKEAAARTRLRSREDVQQRMNTDDWKPSGRPEQKYQHLFQWLFLIFTLKEMEKASMPQLRQQKKLLCLTCGKLLCHTWGWLGEDTDKREADEEVPSVEDKEHSRGCRLIKLRSYSETIPRALFFPFLFVNEGLFCVYHWIYP